MYRDNLNKNIRQFLGDLWEKCVIFYTEWKFNILRRLEIFKFNINRKYYWEYIEIGNIVRNFGDTLISLI